MIIKYNLRARKILANNIIFFRLENEWSQEDFADKLGTTPTYVSTLENAKRNTRIDYIGHIADTLGVSIDQLFKERPKVEKKFSLKNPEDIAIIITYGAIIVIVVIVIILLVK